MKRFLLTSAIILGNVTLAFSQKIIDKQIEVDAKRTEMKLSFADNIKIVI